MLRFCLATFVLVGSVLALECPEWCDADHCKKKACHGECPICLEGQENPGVSSVESGNDPKTSSGDVVAPDTAAVALDVYAANVNASGGNDLAANKSSPSELACHRWCGDDQCQKPGCALCAVCQPAEEEACPGWCGEDHCQKPGCARCAVCQPAEEACPGWCGDDHCQKPGCVDCAVCQPAEEEACPDWCGDDHCQKPGCAQCAVCSQASAALEVTNGKVSELPQTTLAASRLAPLSPSKVIVPLLVLFTLAGAAVGFAYYCTTRKEPSTGLSEDLAHAAGDVVVDIKKDEPEQPKLFGPRKRSGKDDDESSELLIPPYSGDATCADKAQTDEPVIRDEENLAKSNQDEGDVELSRL
uniref:TNFR-Cys domain-containing protein n=1 Tax=Calcidiscus leptoporus TaxID=127549 RepID=A0A7S0IT96_9EUKA|mmetsp:Transcript_2178/g.4883  ORF Transcript_2178/g.4883 Transcript_2178/m.4883 type:complete len:358 (+) Transcript_2178:43-1116(+)